ncbi:uncharacterized protein LOC121987023 [Zingiber officinale]|uniref:uncharacterized protein LOC121987023 n=1 Tax=Zingiber officinale TaxID=94328 RepID=UPI001C4D5B2A|nr:uncharacterized protein LOC121987023 [Zingiber officinale]
MDDAGEFYYSHDLGQFSRYLSSVKGRFGLLGSLRVWSAFKHCGQREKRRKGFVILGRRQPSRRFFLLLQLSAGADEAAGSARTAPPSPAASACTAPPSPAASACTAPPSPAASARTAALLRHLSAVLVPTLPSVPAYAPLSHSGLRTDVVRRSCRRCIPIVCHLSDPCRIRLRVVTSGPSSSSVGSEASTLPGHDDSVSFTTSSLIHPRAPSWARVRSRTFFAFISIFYYYSDIYAFVEFASSTEVPETGGTRSMDTGTVDRRRTSDDLVNVADRSSTGS